MSLAPCPRCESTRVCVRHYDGIAADPGGQQPIVKAGFVCLDCNFIGPQTPWEDEDDETNMAFQANIASGRWDSLARIDQQLFEQVFDYFEN